MKRWVTCVCVSLVVGSVAILAGCGGGSRVGISFPGGTALVIDQGQQMAITATVTNDSANKGVTWSCTGAACTALQNVSGTSVTFAAGTTAGTATITATSAKESSVSGTVTITVTAPPSTTTTQALLTAAPATAGHAYSFSLAASGGAGALTWSATGLPTNGMSMNATTGAITGTPTAKGTVTFTYTVKDSSAAGPMSSTSASLTITVNNPPPPAITTTQAQVSSGTAASPYAFTFHASGTGALTWGATSLPTDGLSLNASTGIVSGTPAAKGTVAFTLTVSDAYGQSSAATAFTITVSNPPPPAITTTQTQLTSGGPAYVGSAYSFTFQATGAGALTWGVTGLPADGLSLNSSTGVVSGTSTTAQPSVPFTLTVSDTFGQSSAPVLFTIVAQNPAPELSVTKTHTGNFLPGQTNATYSVTVSNSGATGSAPTDGTTVTLTDTLPSGLTLVSMAGTGWTCGNPNPANVCTRSDVLGTGSSYPVVTVTVNVAANATSPQVNQVSVFGGGSATANGSDSTNIGNPCGSGSESLLNGSYAILLKGFDNESTPEPVLVGGVLTFNGSTSTPQITSGAIDMNLNSGSQYNLNASGTYSIGSDHRGCMAITTTAGTQNYAFSLGNVSGGVASTGHVIDFDSAGPFTTGVMRKQTIVTSLSGSFAFGVDAAQNTASCNNSICGGKFGAAGKFTFSGSTFTGFVDFNNNGQVDGNNTSWPASPVSVSSGSYSILSSGRGTIQFTPSGSQPVTAVVYVVSSSEFLILANQDQTMNSLFGGTALQQSGSLGTGSLNGISVLYASSFQGGTPPTTKGSIGLITTNGSGTFSFAGWQNGGGSVSPQSASGSYSVASSGRVFLAGTQPVFWLVTKNEGFFLEPSNSVQTGFFEPQSATTASGTFAYGAINPEAYTVNDESGVVTLSSPNISGTSDTNSAGTVNSGKPFSSTYSIDSTGLVTIPAGCTMGTNCQNAIYVISATRAAVLDLTSTSPAIQTADQ